MAEQKLPEVPDLAALALGSLLAQKNDETAPRRERTREERLAGIAALVEAMEASMEEEENP